MVSDTASSHAVGELRALLWNARDVLAGMLEKRRAAETNLAVLNSELQAVHRTREQQHAFTENSLHQFRVVEDALSAFDRSSSTSQSLLSPHFGNGFAPRERSSPHKAFQSMLGSASVHVVDSTQQAALRYELEQASLAGNQFAEDKTMYEAVLAAEAKEEAAEARARQAALSCRNLRSQEEELVRQLEARKADNNEIKQQCKSLEKEEENWIHKHAEAEQQSAAAFARFEEEIVALDAQHQGFKAELKVAQSEHSLDTTMSEAHHSHLFTSKLSTTGGYPFSKLSLDAQPSKVSGAVSSPEQERTPSPPTGHSALLEQERLSRKPKGHNVSRSQSWGSESALLEMPSPVKPHQFQSPVTSWAGTTIVADEGFQALEIQVVALEQELQQSMAERQQLERRTSGLEEECRSEVVGAEQKASLAKQRGAEPSGLPIDPIRLEPTRNQGIRAAAPPGSPRVSNPSLAATAAQACAKRQGQGVSFTWPRWDYKQAGQQEHAASSVFEACQRVAATAEAMVEEQSRLINDQNERGASPWRLSASPFHTPGASANTPSRWANESPSCGSGYQSHILQREGESSSVRSPKFGSQAGFSNDDLSHSAWSLNTSEEVRDLSPLSFRVPGKGYQAW